MKRFGLLALLIGATTAPAQTNAPAETRELSLQDCVQLALQHNLDLQIERYNPQIARFGLSAAYGGYEPSLFLSGQHDHNESRRQQNFNTGTGTNVVVTTAFVPSGSDANRFNSTVGGLFPWGMTYSLDGSLDNTYGFNSDPTNRFENSSGSASVSVVQPLLKNFWIDGTRLNIRVAKNRLKVSELALKLQVMAVITTVEQAYYDLIYNRENVLVQEKAVELANALVRENSKRVEVGAMAPLDEQQASAQAATTQASLIAARAALGTQERALKSLITDQFARWHLVELIPSGTLTVTAQNFDLQKSWTRGLTQRPDLLQAKLDVEHAGIQLKFDRNQLYPQLDVFGTYGFNGSGREFSGSLADLEQRNQNFYTYGGRITVPLGNIAARSNYRSSKASEQQVILALKRLEQNIMLQIDDTIGALRANFEQVQATRVAREYQEKALDAEQKRLENGKSTTYTVLQVQRDLTSARGAEILALGNYNKSLAQLSLDEGSTLERLGIGLELKPEDGSH
jgi:outer membrane protein